jgi:hypothetical protein
MIECNICHRKFKTEEALQSHMKTHPQIQTTSEEKHEETIEDFIKGLITQNIQENDIISQTLNKYQNKTYAEVKTIVETLLIPPTPPVQTPPLVIEESEQEHLVFAHKKSFAFTKFKDYNIEITFGNIKDKYYTDLPSEILQEMRDACYNAMLEVIKKHQEIYIKIVE